MTLPTIEKTWQFNVNRNIGALGTNLAVNKQLLLDMKNMLIATGSLGTWTNASGATITPANPWTVRYSCNGTTAGSVGDGVDRWQSTSDMNPGQMTGVTSLTTTARSWIVLKNTTLDSGGNFQVLFDWMSDTNQGVSQWFDYGSCTIYVSRTAGFTGGTTTTRPSATDEVFCGSGFTATTQVNTNFVAYGTYCPIFGDFGSITPGGTGLFTGGYTLHCLTAADGTSYRLIVSRGSAVSFILAFEKLSNGNSSAWATPNFIIHASAQMGDPTTNSGTSIGNSDALYTACKQPYMVTALAPGGGKYKCYLSTEALEGQFMPQKFGLNAISNQYLLAQIDLMSLDTGFLGRQGYVTDLWMGTTPPGSTMPPGGPNNYAQFGSFVVPWNTTNPLT